MKSHWKQLAALMAFAVALAGCGKSASSTVPTPPTNTDVAGATSGMASSPTLLVDDLFDVTATTGASAHPAQPMTAIDPLTFYRWFSAGTRNFTFAFSDSDSAGHPRQADVTVRRDLYGMLNIIQRPLGGTEPDTHNVVHKPFHDVWTRHLHLVRVLVAGDHGMEPRWHVESTSGINVASQPGDRAITSMHIVGSGLDVTVTDPAQLMSLTQLPHATANDSVTVTVTSGAMDDICVLYWHDHRERMHPNGDGTCSLKLWVGVMPGLRGIGVNVLSHGTLFDDTVPYNSLAWIVPIWVGDAPPTVWP